MEEIGGYNDASSVRRRELMQVQIPMSRQMPAGIEKNTMMRMVAKLSEELLDDDDEEE